MLRSAIVMSGLAVFFAVPSHAAVSISLTPVAADAEFDVSSADDYIVTTSVDSPPGSSLAAYTQDTDGLNDDLLTLGTTGLFGSGSGPTVAYDGNAGNDFYAFTGGTEGSIAFTVNGILGVTQTIQLIADVFPGYLSPEVNRFATLTALASNGDTASNSDLGGPGNDPFPVLHGVYTITYTAETLGETLSLTLAAPSDDDVAEEVTNVGFSAISTTVVPEPVTAALALLGLTLLGRRRG